MKNLNNFVKFCKSQARYGDTDPHVVLFRTVAKREGLTREERIWLCFLCMAYYHEGSGWAAFKKLDGQKKMPPAKYPISQARRNLFGGRIVQHFEWLLEKKKLRSWLNVTTWSALLDRVQEVYGNGHWAGYTTAEMLVKMKCVDVGMPDTLEIAGSTGPSSGLKFLGVEQTEEGANRVHKALVANGLFMPSELFESVLCNWSTLCKGTFYSGANIDRQQSRILQIEEVTGKKFPELWKARRIGFDPRCLGELHGWSVTPKERKQVYLHTEVVLRPYEDRVMRFPR